MQKFESPEKYQEWIDGQQWYQTIELKSGAVAKGRFPTQNRASLFDHIDFAGKTVLDIGCNSGQYCFMAKDRGASEVTGLDINTERIEQAKTLALNEGYEHTTFHEKGIFELGDLERQYDVVLCIAVITEIQDFIGAVEQLKKVVGSYALIELDIAKPLVYISRSKYWWMGYKNVSRRNAVAEMRYSKQGGWVFSPTFAILQELFGDEFALTRKGKGVRYDLVEVVKVK